MSGGYDFLFKRASSVTPSSMALARCWQFLRNPLLTLLFPAARMDALVSRKAGCRERPVQRRGVRYVVTLALASLLALASPAWAENGATSKGVPNVVPPKGEHVGKHVEQPIEFPHDIHTKVNGINCMYCHTYARRSKVAGIPPTSKCMGCHLIIATDKPRIKKLTEYWEKREPVIWKKVHDVPDFVHFTHEKHLKRFVFDNEGMSVDRVSEVCAFCHGDLKKMTVANKVKPLTMGFCVRCHEANKGPFDCWKCHK